jgi:hypothetical protein
VLRCDVVGRILMKCHLSDMPELRLGLSDTPEDVTFHQCVNLVSGSFPFPTGSAAAPRVLRRSAGLCERGRRRDGGAEAGEWRRGLTAGACKRRLLRLLSQTLSSPENPWTLPNPHRSLLAEALSQNLPTTLAALAHLPPFCCSRHLRVIPPDGQGTYEAQQVVTFIPPDGEFELMK